MSWNLHVLDVHRPDMSNVTSCLAIRILRAKLTKSQQSPGSLTINDITANEEDCRIVHESRNLCDGYSCHTFQVFRGSL